MNFKTLRVILVLQLIVTVPVSAQTYEMPGKWLGTFSHQGRCNDDHRKLVVYARGYNNTIARDTDKGKVIDTHQCHLLKAKATGNGGYQLMISCSTSSKDLPTTYPLAPEVESWKSSNRGIVINNKVGYMRCK